MHIQRNSSGGFAIHIDRKRLDGRMPAAWFVYRREPQSEQFAAEIEDGLLYRAVFEVRSRAPCIETQLRSIELLSKVLGLPDADRSCAWLFALLQVQQRRELRLDAGTCQLLHALQKCSCIRGRSNHLVFSDVVCPACVTQRRCQLMTLRQQLPQYAQIGWRATNVKLA